MRVVGVTAPAGAKAKVESAYTPTDVRAGEWNSWSFTVHNIGGTGIFGGAVWLVKGKPVKVRWRDEEHIVEPGKALIIYYDEPKPYCTRVSTEGEIQYPEEGSYIIRLAGVHQEAAGWIADDYKEFGIMVTAPERATVEGTVRGFLGMPVGGAIVRLNGARTVTKSDGSYSFTDVELGDYTLSVEHWLYDRYEESISIKRLKTYRVDVNLSMKLAYKVLLAATPIGAVGAVYALRRK